MGAVLMGFKSPVRESNMKREHHGKHQPKSRSGGQPSGWRKTRQEPRADEQEPHRSLNQILNICSLQWAFERVYRLKPAFTPASLAFGSAFHRVMEWIAHVRRQEEIPVASDVRDLFTEVWKREAQDTPGIRYDEDEPVENLAAQGRDLVGCYVAFLDPEERIARVNETFAVPVRDLGGNTLDRPLVGEIDCVVEKAGLRSLVDWKTSARRWSKGQMDAPSRSRAGRGTGRRRGWSA